MGIVDNMVVKDIFLMLYVGFLGFVIVLNFDLVFEVELIQVYDGFKFFNVFKMIDIDNDDYFIKDEVRNLLVDYNKLGGGVM